MANTLTGGRLLAEALHGMGVEHVFFMDAILRRALVEMEDLGIGRVLTHSEKAAAYMADGYARAGRRLGVCMAQSVGAANLASGLQDAFLARVPILALSGRQPANRQYRNTHQEVPHEPFYASVAKASLRVDQADQLPLLLNQAAVLATSGSPRPVHLDVLGHTGDIVGLADCTGLAPPPPRDRKGPAFRVMADTNSVQAAAAMLDRSQRPVIVVGLGVMWSGAQAELALLALRLGAAVCTTMDAKAALPDDFPLHAGVAGVYSRACANQVLAAADTVLFVACDTGDWITNDWKLPLPKTPTIQLDPDPAEIGRNFPDALGMQADPLLGLRQLVEAVADRSRPDWAAQVGELIRAWRHEADALRSMSDGPVRPERILAELEAVLPGDAILVADTGHSSHFSGNYFYLRQGQDYLRAAGSLGWGFPASLGAQLARPDATVVCFTGDGGFLYHLSELETAKRRGLATVTIVNNNGRLQQGKRNIAAAYGGRAGNMAELYVFNAVDYAAIARGFGCFGIRVSSAAEIRPAWEAARASGLPAVIDVLIDSEATPPPPWMPV